jgi:hypothetical protein
MIIKILRGLEWLKYFKLYSIIIHCIKMMLKNNQTFLELNIPLLIHFIILKSFYFYFYHKKSNY